jgi:PAS domain S-box-containing protein
MHKNEIFGELSNTSIADAAPQCIKLISADGIVQYINKAGLSFIEADSANGIIGSVVFDFIPLPFREQWREMHTRVCAGEELDWEYEVVGMKGTLRYLETHAVPMLMQDGTIAQLAITKDVTNQKKAEQAVRENEDKLKAFRTLANKMLNLAWMADAEGNLYWYNNRFYEYTGTTLEEMKGWGWQRLHHPADYEKMMAFVAAAWKNNQPFEVEHLLLGKDGNYRWFLSQATPVHDANGNLLQWVGTLTDIDEQKTSLALLEDMVTERTEQLRRSNEELQQFAHVASHDLKEPLRKARLFGSMLKEQLRLGNTERALTYIDKIDHAAERMTALIDGILQYAAVDVRHQGNAAVNLNDLLDQVVNDLELAFQQKNARLLRKDVLPLVTGVNVLLYQLLFNIISNALKFTRPDVTPVIEITASIADAVSVKEQRLDVQHQYTMICIKDNGIGFDPQTAKDIFRTYYRGSTQYEGTGLGLSLCKKIAERHGGTISAEGIAGEGAMFKIMLPVR